MTFLFKRKPLLLPLLACLTAGSTQAATDIAAPALQPWTAKQSPGPGFYPDGMGDGRLAVSKREGIVLLDKQGKTLSRVAGAFAGLDSRRLGDRVLVASSDKDKQQVALFDLDPGSHQWQPPVYLPPGTMGSMACVCIRTRRAISICLPWVKKARASSGWWLPTTNGCPTRAWCAACRCRRRRSFARSTTARSSSFVNEENVGWWAYPAQAESDVSRLPVAMIEPFGNVKTKRRGHGAGSGRGCSGLTLKPRN